MLYKNIKGYATLKMFVDFSTQTCWASKKKLPSSCCASLIKYRNWFFFCSPEIAHNLQHNMLLLFIECHYSNRTSINTNSRSSRHIRWPEPNTLIPIPIPKWDLNKYAVFVWFRWCRSHGVAESWWHQQVPLFVFITLPEAHFRLDSFWGQKRRYPADTRTKKLKHPHNSKNNQSLCQGPHRYSVVQPHCFACLSVLFGISTPSFFFFVDVAALFSD